jgi:uncharacterized protein YraI
VLVIITTIIAVVPMFTVQADYGTNWTGRFFNNASLTDPGVDITGINGLNFNWGGGGPIVNGQAVPGIGTDNFSARFTSTQNLTPGVYSFVVSSDDGVRLYVNGGVVLDKFIGRALTTDTISVTISTSPVNLTVEYFEGIDQAILQVQWFLVSSTTAIPGQTQVFGTPAVVATAVPAAAITIAGVKAEALRTGPYLGASFIGEVAAGTPLNPLARNKDEGIYNWYLINTGTKTGWISGRYVTLTGDINAIPLQSTVFEQIDGAPDVGVLAVPRSVMNLRKRPSIRSARLMQIPWGAETILIGRTIQAGKNFWLQVRYNGQVGWIFAPYVSIRGDVNAVPIR